MDAILGKTYRIDQRLGRGGMGSVYRAHDTILDRPVAIKVMHPHLSDDPDFSARFLQEARAIAGLQHPGIVQVYACGQDLGLLYMVMDFIPGQTLHDWLNRLAAAQEIVVLRESLAIVEQIALALHYAHVKGVVHRDVKPSNVMIRPTDPVLRRPGDLPFCPVLTDFGLAKLAAGGVNTRTGSSLGTPAYMSPEQCRGLDLDGRTDIYSLGVVLFQMVTGRVPFEVQSLTEAIRCHTEEPPPPPRSVNPTLPVEVENVVLRALAKRPQDRFASALHVAQALRAAIPRLPPDLASAGLSVAHPVPGTEAEGAGEAPTAYISLMTLLGDEGADPPFRSNAQSMDARSDRPGGAGLIVIASNGQRRRIPLDEGRVLTIGRVEGNDIQLDDQRVSRRHARVEFHGRRLTITDLNSTNGSFLGNSRLLPGVPQLWSPDAVLQLGDHRLRFEAQAAPEGSLVDASLPLPAAGSPPDAPRADVALDPQRLGVEAGASVECRISARNLGVQVDHFQIAISGIPSTWIPAPPPVLLLNPDEQEETRLTIQPPRSPHARADAYPITIALVSQTTSARVAETKGILTLAPYYQLDLALRPQRQSGPAEGRFCLEVSNRGNADLSVSWEATDPEEGCHYVFDPPQAVLAPGQDRSVQLLVRPKTPLLRPVSKTYPFVVTARPVQAPEQTREVQGEWAHLPPDFDLELVLQSQAGSKEGHFELQILNHGPSDLSLQLRAADPENNARYDLQPQELTVSAGSHRQAQLTVRPPVLPEGSMGRTLRFVVTAVPVSAPRLVKQAEGEWKLLPPVRDKPQPQIPSGAPSRTPQVQVRKEVAADLGAQPGATLVRTYPFWGCATLLLALALTVLAGWGVGFVTAEVLDLNDLAMLFAVVVWLGGLVLSIVIARLVWRRRVRLPPRPSQLPEE